MADYQPGRTRIKKMTNAQRRASEKAFAEEAKNFITPQDKKEAKRIREYEKKHAVKKPTPANAGASVKANQSGTTRGGGGGGVHSVLPSGMMRRGSKIGKEIM